MNRSSKDRFYFPELDGLRFFAFLAVFLSHVATFSNGANSSRPVIIELFNMFGRFGVDLFFALSAFLLTSLMLKEKDRFGSLRVGAFYMRRLLRIWPLYFTWLAVLIVTRQLWSNYSFDFFVPFLLFGGNLAAAFSLITSIVVLPLWSVSIEEQFYILWPLLMRNLTRRGVVAAGAAIWIFTTVARFGLLRAGMTPHQLWFIGFARLGAIALGIIMAALPQQSVRFRGLCFASGLICWAGAATCHLYAMHPEGYEAPMLGFSFAAIGAGAFLLATLGVKSGGLLTRPDIVYLGRISYGLYIFHGAALVMASHMVPSTAGFVFWPVFVLIAFSIAVVFSSVSYRWLESPFLRLKKRYEVIRSAPILSAAARPSGAPLEGTLRMANY